jgi:hypothetical protein
VRLPKGSLFQVEGGLQQLIMYAVPLEVRNMIRVEMRISITIPSMKIPYTIPTMKIPTTIPSDCDLGCVMTGMSV